MMGALEGFKTRSIGIPESRGLSPFPHSGLAVENWPVEFAFGAKRTVFAA